MKTPVVEVRIWDERVGAVATDPRLGCYVFAYAPTWVQKNIELSPLVMPLAGARRPVAFPELSQATYHGLPGLLADSLPDDFGNALIDAYMATHGLSKESVTPLDRLSYMGKRGLGALEYKPARGSFRESQEPLQMKLLVEAARRVVSGTLSTEVDERATLTQIIRVGSSAGGARAKAVVAWNPTTHELRSGQFDAPPGFEHWLLKFDGMGPDHELGPSDHYGRIEYAYFLMARRAGVDMSPCRLLEENGRAHFMTRRFDRDVVQGVTQKHHIQTLSALSHLDFRLRATHDYAQLLLTIRRLGLGPDALQQAFRRMVFNVLSRNCDDHPKNFAFRLRQGKDWELAPAYDVTYAYNPQGVWTHQHLMGVQGHFEGISREHLLTLADRFEVPRAATMLKEVRDVIETFSSFARESGLPPKQAEALQATFPRGFSA